MARKSLRKGLLLTFEGPEGCGKTTHAKLLARYLESLGMDIVLTREPGGTPLGEEVRKVLLHSKGIAISNLAEVFLFEACRSQVVEEIIKPNLLKNKIVICDRFSDATFAYQGYAGGIDLSDIAALDIVAARGIKPDLTILLDVDAAAGLKKAKAKGVDRMESKEIVYHKKVRAGYLKLARREPDRIKVIKVAGSIDETQELVRKEAGRVIQKYQRAG